MTDSTISLTAVDALVIAVVIDETGRSEVYADSTFGELDIESLTFAEILMGIEDKLTFKLDLEESFALDRSATIGDLIKAVQAEIL